MPTYTQGDKGSSSSSVSEVNSDELARMIERVNVEDTPNLKIDPKVPSQLKSSIRSSPNNSQRKVQFINTRKNEDVFINLDDPLGDMDLSDYDSTNNDNMKLEIKSNQHDMKSNIEKPSNAQNVKVTQNIPKALSPIKVNASSLKNIGTVLNLNEKSTPKMDPQESPYKSKIVSRRTSLQPTLGNEDNLFSIDGKVSTKREFSPARQGARRNSSFMTDLFGDKKSDQKEDLKGEFKLEDKYKQMARASTISENTENTLTDVSSPIKNGGNKAESVEIGSKANTVRRGRRGTAPTLRLRSPESDTLKNKRYGYYIHNNFLQFSMQTLFSVIII